MLPLPCGSTCRKLGGRLNEPTTPHLEGVRVEKLGRVVLRARQQQGAVLVQCESVDVLRVHLLPPPKEAAAASTRHPLASATA